MIDVKKWLSKLTAQTEKKTLLWTNPNPTSVFAPQTISLNLSEYDEVQIYFIQDVGDTRTISRTTCLVGTRGMLGMPRGDVYYSQVRVFTVNTNSIEFSQGLAGNGNVFDRLNVPYKIYGIKWGV